MPMTVLTVSTVVPCARQTAWFHVQSSSSLVKPFRPGYPVYEFAHFDVRGHGHTAICPEKEV